MLIYRRDITTKLLLLRFGFLAAVLLSGYLFWMDLEDYGLLLAFLMVFGCVFPVTGLRIENECFIIQQYYCFALFSRSWLMVKGNSFSLHPFDLEVSDAGYLDTDSIWDVFTLFLPAATASVRKYVVKCKNEDGTITQVKMKLSMQECNLIQQHFLL